jgi:predicted nucleic acid-binding protein
MTGRLVLDASVLIAATEPSDAHHPEAAQIMTAAAPGAMFVHPLTLAEVLVGGVRTGAGQELRAPVAAAGGVTASGDAADPLDIAAVRHAAGLRLPDAVVLATAQVLDASLATFDVRLARAARDLGISVEPSRLGFMPDTATSCQSCAMPLGPEAGPFGTGADGTPSPEYCEYCYQGGAFTQDCTMEEMIEVCVPHMTAANPGMTEDAARDGMRAYFPTLKRWQLA